MARNTALTQTDLDQFAQQLAQLQTTWTQAAAARAPHPEHLLKAWADLHHLSAKITGARQAADQDPAADPAIAAAAQTLDAESRWFGARATANIAARFAESPGIVLPLAKVKLPAEVQVPNVSEAQLRMAVANQPDWWAYRAEVELAPFHGTTYDAYARAEYHALRLRVGFALAGQDRPDEAAHHLNDAVANELDLAISALRTTENAWIDPAWLRVQSEWVKRQGRSVEADALSTEAAAVGYGIEAGQQATIASLQLEAQRIADAYQDFAAGHRAAPAVPLDQIDRSMDRVNAVDASVHAMKLIAEQAASARDYPNAAWANAIAATRLAGVGKWAESRALAEKSWTQLRGVGAQAADGFVHASAMLNEADAAQFWNEQYAIWAALEPRAATSLASTDIAALRSLTERLVDGGRIDIATSIADLARDQTSARHGLKDELGTPQALLAADIRTRAREVIGNDPDARSWFEAREGCVLANRAQLLEPGRAHDELNAQAIDAFEIAIPLAQQAGNLGRLIDAQHRRGAIYAEYGDTAQATAAREAGLAEAMHLFAHDDTSAAWGAYTRDEIIAIASDLRDSLGLPFDPDLGRPVMTPTIDLTDTSPGPTTTREYSWADTPDVAPAPQPSSERAPQPLPAPVPQPVGAPAFTHADPAHTRPPQIGGIGF